MANLHINADTKIGYGNKSLGDLEKEVEDRQNFIVCDRDSNVTLSKSTAYGGTQIPINRLRFRNGDMFYLQDNKIYCKYNGFVQITIQIPMNYDTGYVLFGSTNGSYTSFAGPSNASGLAGSTVVGTAIFDVSAGEWLTVAFGHNHAYSDLIIYADVKVTAQLIKRI